MTDSPIPFSKTRLIWLATAVGALAVGAVLAAWPMRGEILEMARESLAWLNNRLQHANPLVFFGALAILPSIGAPVSPFYIAAGAFGWPVGLLGCSLAIAINMTLTYWLARRLLKPFLAHLVRRTRWTIPEARTTNQARLTLLVRITPGFPFPLQNYVLGLAEVAFPTYLAVSLSVQVPAALGMMLLGQSLFQGRGGLALLGICLVVALVIVIRILHERYAGRVRTN